MLLNETLATSCFEGDYIFLNMSKESILCKFVVVVVVTTYKKTKCH